MERALSVTPKTKPRVVVVGAGATGAAFACRAAEAGLEVTCLERGHWAQSDTSPSDRPDWEMQRLTNRSPNPSVRQSKADYPILDDTSVIKPATFNGVGGSTVLWSAHSPRFRPSDFRVRSLDGVGADWPITYWDLAPYYELNDQVVGVSGRSGDPGNPPRTPRQTPPVPLGIAGRRVAQALNRLGWHWWPTDGQILTDPFNGRPACNGCGPCEMGCFSGARASADNTYWPRALAAGASLITGAAATRINTDSDGRATSVEWCDEMGTRHETQGDYIVLACNGIGTPRLLLASANADHPHGLANSSGQVGRNLMLHPIAGVTGIWNDRVDGWSGNDAFSLLSQHFYETETDRGFVRGYEMQLTRSQGPMLTALGGFGLDITWGPDHHRRFDAVFGHCATLAVTCEDLPSEHNFISLDESMTDRFGVPAARMHYQVEDNAHRMLDHGIESARRLLLEAGAREIVTTRVLPGAGFHLMGTARMGQDPDKSVVAADCRAHDVPNLLVIDGSVFASAAAVNPTPTMQAIALRAADLLIGSLT